MSIHSPRFSQETSEHDYHITIVASSYNAQFVDPLVAAAQREILASAPKTAINIIHVPGAFEIPLAIKLIAQNQLPDAIIALGVILRGETAHAHLIGNAVTPHLLDISLEYDIPVVHGVLMLDNEIQARERCLGDTFNRGIEAARTALSMIALIDKISLC